MAAYVVAMIDVHDPETYRKYTDRTPATVKKHGGRFVTRGGAVTALEGDGFDGRMVILEFPDKAAAEAWYADTDYVQARTFRHAASTAHLFALQEGAADTRAPDPKL
ncbi:MAG: DUF1330 domain-containing protein [Acidobacteriota bacterium]|nr:DUF1330 domain-containing protein [Acidobacteriota bacterium]MDE2710869.1 DUF1330 domain-containing protein [Acidobacteriota bacterium]MXW72378.1 DUF1330 domain-containing protein [Acidobacteriota bacterium]MXX86045.1 DUF1330 domain-containing protein [Acidobacteriota bacterium]MYE43352.1 DUF1330 domain-containing protein [Acidobacteriota bacterium]